MSETEQPTATLAELYQKAQKKKAELLFKNFHYQHRLAEYFRRKKTTESQTTLKTSLSSHNVDDNDPSDALAENNHEQRYAKYLLELKCSQQNLVRIKQESEKEIAETKDKRRSYEAQVKTEWEKLIDLYRTISTQAVSSRTGHTLALKDIDNHIKQLEAKEELVSQVRLENIKVTNKFRKQEAQLKSKEELADGLHLIDFEQLKIENQTYNEKIEERNEELLKLHQKITNTVQVLTHYKEKLQFMESDSTVQTEKLEVLEDDVIMCRDSLAKMKQQRDRLRNEYHKLQQNAGLLGSIGAGNTGHKKSLILLHDFEVRQDEIRKLEKDIEQFKKRHTELAIDIKSTEKKLAKTRETATN